jgi:hypothetical protein
MFYLLNKLCIIIHIFILEDRNFAKLHTNKTQTKHKQNTNKQKTNNKNKCTAFKIHLKTLYIM